MFSLETVQLAVAVAFVGIWVFAGRIFTRDLR